MTLGHDNDSLKNGQQAGVAQMLIFCTIKFKNSPKTAKKATVAFKHGAFSILGVGMMIFDFQEVPRVCYTPPKQAISYIFNTFEKVTFRILAKIYFFSTFLDFSKGF